MELKRIDWGNCDHDKVYRKKLAKNFFIKRHYKLDINSLFHERSTVLEYNARAVNKWDRFADFLFTINLIDAREED